MTPGRNWQLASSALNCNSKAPHVDFSLSPFGIQLFLVGHWRSSLLVVWRSDLQVETPKVVPSLKISNTDVCRCLSNKSTLTNLGSWDDKYNLPFASICLVPSIKNQDLKIAVRVHSLCRYTLAFHVGKVPASHPHCNGQVGGRASPNISIRKSKLSSGRRGRCEPLFAFHLERNRTFFSRDTENTFCKILQF